MKPGNLTELYYSTSSLRSSLFYLKAFELNKLPQSHKDNFKKLLEKVRNECEKTLAYMAKEE